MPGRPTFDSLPLFCFRDPRSPPLFSKRGAGARPRVGWGGDYYAGVSTLSYFRRGTINSATILITLIIGLIAGPAVSLYGSPTVSPVTAAL